mmetsp:Transcript_13180/g.14974  ORF Transcript_13180/g.14974 Transcript_13180/m.14974 type:complete len:323 (+) Transcript_13180:140-1108(+)
MMKLFSNSTIVVMVVLQVVNVVQAKASKPCSELSRKQCKKSAVCGIFEDACISTIIGELSIVRDGQNNFAPGKLCTVGGGEGNLAGTDEDQFSVVGGGKSNSISGDTNVISGGKRNAIVRDMEESFLKVMEGNTISGGYDNVMETGDDGVLFSVITGGRFNFVFPETKKNIESATISGGIGNGVLANGGTVTGGDSCGQFSEGGTNSVISGGFGNDAAGIGAVAMGSKFNNANGDYSISFGSPNTFANNDHSMVINLMDFGLPPTDLDYCSENDEFSVCSTDDGQFLAYAEQFTFQIGNNVDTRLNINKDNMKNLLDVLNED